MGKGKLIIINLLIIVLITGGGSLVESEKKGLNFLINKYNLTNIISTYTTYFDKEEENRVQNIKIGAQKLDRTVVKSGEIFSFNHVLGPRTKERGYKEAPEIINGKLVPGIGGGICQLSSTLYNAVLLANLEVVERVHHSRPVSYVSLGRGATVYYKEIDFKFKNNTPSPIVITAKVLENQVTVSILGRKNKVQVEIVTLKTKLEPKVKKEIDKSLPVGSKKTVKEGQKGFKVIVKKVVKKGEKILNKVVVSEDIYPPEDQIIKIHPKK